MAQPQHVSAQKRLSVLAALKERHGQRLTAPEPLSGETGQPETDKSLSLLLADQKIIAAKRADPTISEVPTALPTSVKPVPAARPAGQRQDRVQEMIPATLLAELKQWASSAEIDLSGVEIEQLEQRYAELQYYSKWLITLYKEVQKEVFLLRTQLQSRQSERQSPDA